MQRVYDHQLEERFDDVLNEICPVVSICGYDYDPARALKSVDPIAYHQEYLNWLDVELTEGRYVCEDGNYFEADE